MSLRPKTEHTDSKPYIVHVSNFGDTVERLSFATFSEALKGYAEAVKNYTSKWHHVSIYNDDRADGGYGDDGSVWYDGLTPDEVDEVLQIHP